jgi:hypothetical protein
MTATTTFGRVTGGVTGRGAFRRAFERLVVARELQARRYVSAYLAGLDDATLASYGYDREAVERMGRGTFGL